MKLEKNQIEQMLALFDLETGMNTVRSFEVLVNIDFQRDKWHVVKYYVRVFCPEHSYFLKLLSLPMCSYEQLHMQRVYAEKFRNAGLPTARQYSVREKNRYLAEVSFSDEIFWAAVEENLGQEVSPNEPDYPYLLGKLLGKIHQIAEDEKLQVWEGSFAREFRRGNTEYLKLWSPCGTAFLPQDTLQAIAEVYDEKIHRMKNLIDSLPCYAVQGDLYFMNILKRNLKMSENSKADEPSCSGTSSETIGIIDFDRLGNESLLTDFIITWCRYVFDPRVWANRKQTLQKDFALFYSGYQCNRSLTVCEKEAFTDCYTVLASVYGTKMLLAMTETGHQKDVSEGLGEIYAAICEADHLSANL